METVNYYEDLQYSEIRDRLQKHLLKSMESYDDPALKLGRPFLYNTSDSVTYVSPYHGMNRKQINKIEKETLDRYVLEMYSDYYRKY